MARNVAKTLFEDIRFTFLTPGEDKILKGTVRLERKKMVLEVEDNGKYLIEGAQRDYWYEGSHSIAGTSWHATARWAAVGDLYVGVWFESGYEWLFSFTLRSGG